MTTPVPVPFVFISFTEDVMKKLFTSELPLQVEDLVKEYSGENQEALLFSNYANPNIISLEHKQNYDKATTIEVEIIDPNNEFELRMITLSNYPNTFKDVLKESNEYKGLKEAFDSNRNDINKQKLRQFSLEYIKLFTETNQERDFFIAYGVGTDIQTWAGPFRCQLMQVDVNFTEFKKFKLVFKSSGNSIGITDLQKGTNKQNEILKTYNFKNHYRKQVVSGRSKKINFEEYINGTSNSIYPARKSDTEFLKKFGLQSTLIQRNFPEINSFFLKYSNLVDFHQLITDCMRDYLRKITGLSNVIVLLPNLNVLAQTLGKDIKLDRVEKLIENIDLKIKTKQSLITEDFLKQFLGFFRIYLVNETSANSTPQSLNTAIQSIQNSSTEKLLMDSITGDFYCEINDTRFGDELPDYYERITDVISLINRYLPTAQIQPIDPVLFYESNTNIINTWENYRKENKEDYYTFNDGNSSASGGNYVVFGDKTLVSKYLYGSQKVTYSKSETEQQQNYYFNNIIIHYLDSLLVDSDYNEKIRKVALKPLNTTPFGSISDFPDTFTYKTKFSTDINKNFFTGLPVFRYNTSNPNVESLQVVQNLVYTEQLRLGFQKELIKGATNHLAGQYSESLKDGALSSRESIIAYVLNKLNKGLSDQEKTKLEKELADELSTNSPVPIYKSFGSYRNAEELAKAFIAAAEEIQKYPNKRIQVIDKLTTKSSVEIYADIAEQVHDKIMSLRIKTVPFVFLSGNAVINLPCLLFAQTPKIIGEAETGIRFTDLITNYYLIKGYKHTLRDNQMYSEFVLVRAPITSPREAAINNLTDQRN